eukprot:5889654-Pleurochrysis_carterae.AAC.1
MGDVHACLGFLLRHHGAHAQLRVAERVVRQHAVHNVHGLGVRHRGLKRAIQRFDEGVLRVPKATPPLLVVLAPHLDADVQHEV